MRRNVLNSTSLRFTNALLFFFFFLQFSIDQLLRPVFVFSFLVHFLGGQLFPHSLSCIHSFTVFFLL